MDLMILYSLLLFLFTLASWVSGTDHDVVQKTNNTNATLFAQSRGLQRCDISLKLWDATNDVELWPLEDGDTVETCLADSFSVEVVAPCYTYLYMWLESYVEDNTLVLRRYGFDLGRPFMVGNDDGYGDIYSVDSLKMAGGHRLQIEYPNNDGYGYFQFTTVACEDSILLGEEEDADGGGDGGDDGQEQLQEHTYRFSKITFLPGHTASVLPLGAADYPLDDTLTTTLKRQTLAHSVITPNDYELQDIASIDPYVQAAGGLPQYPNNDANSEFWQNFRYVVDVQVQRRSNVDPTTVMTLPNLWIAFTIDEVAEAVHNEFPGYWPGRLLEYLWRQGVELDYDVLPFRCERDFIGYEFRLADLNTWATGVVAPLNFLMKWNFGYPRPEEIAWLIATGTWTTTEHGVPADILSTINGWGLNDATDFTAYPEGCPSHPSWPAMHSAASSASLWMAVVLKLNAQQYCEALRMDYAVSFARTVAGVHFAPDNIAGLNLGQEIVARKLADHLSTKYGSNRAAVQDKIDKFRFDWADYDPNNCPGLP